MSEWWTYRPSSFLLYSARTYERLFELYNAALWPAQIPVVFLGLALVGLAGRGDARCVRPACALLAAAWLWVAWGFHLQRYAAINWAAPAFAAASALQGLLLLGVGAAGRAVEFTPRGWRRGLGLAVVTFAVIGMPLLAPLTGRSWMQAELFGLAPDPTAMGTLGVLLLLRRQGSTPARSPSAWATASLWPVPLLWCALTSVALAVLQSPTAGLPATVAALVLCARWGDRPAGGGGATPQEK